VLIGRLLLAIKNILWISTNAISLQFYVGDTDNLIAFVQTIPERDFATYCMFLWAGTCLLLTFCTVVAFLDTQ